MRVDPGNIIDTYMDILENNIQYINSVCNFYEEGSKLHVFKGLRSTVPEDCFPCLEFDVNDGANQWATTRGQRPRFSFTLKLTTLTSNENLHLEYISKVTTAIVRVLTMPANLQPVIKNEVQWSSTGELVQVKVLDSLVDNVSYRANKEGTIRSSELSLFVTVHEVYQEGHWNATDPLNPDLIAPTILE